MLPTGIPSLFLTKNKVVVYLLSIETGVSRGDEGSKTMPLPPPYAQKPYVLFVYCRNDEVNTEERDLIYSMLTRTGIMVEFECAHASEVCKDTLIPHRNSGVIIGGSDRSAYDPILWMPRLTGFIQACYEDSVALLGICFGHQVIAATLARGLVKQAPNGREFGNASVDLTLDGMKDPLFIDVPNTFVALETHADVVAEISCNEEVRILAESPHTSVQSLAIGTKIRTVQFHPECSPRHIVERAHRRRQLLFEEGFFHDDEEFDAFISGLEETPNARKVFRNFLQQFVMR